MNKSRSKSHALTPAKPAISHFSKFAARARGLSLPKRFRAAIALDSEKRPAWFLFDAYAFWEFLCRIDVALFDLLSDEEYSSSKNPVGGLIDEIEAHWPLSEESKAEMKREYERALRDIASGRFSPLAV